jgi:hypothetical protein
VGLKEGGQGLRDTVQHMAGCPLLLIPFHLFEVLPADQQLLGIADLQPAPDVGVPPLDLPVYGGDDVGHPEIPLLGGDLGVQDNL